MSENTSPSIAAVRDLREASCGPIGAPTVTNDLSENVILTSLDDLHNWARLSSLWPLLYGTACCFIEFAALLGSRFDFDRFGRFDRLDGLLFVAHRCVAGRDDSIGDNSRQ